MSVVELRPVLFNRCFSHMSAFDALLELRGDHFSSNHYHDFQFGLDMFEPFPAQQMWKLNNTTAIKQSSCPKAVIGVTRFTRSCDHDLHLSQQLYITPNIVKP